MTESGRQTSRSLRAVLVMAVATSGAACASWHSARNAPGVDDVRVPPRDLRSREVELPSDPGEHVLLWNAGVLGGVGPSIAPDQPGRPTTRGAASVSGETSVHLGWSDQTELESERLVPGLGGTGVTLGVNLGWTLGTTSRVSDDAGYVELQVSDELLVSLAGGAAYDVGRHRSGPQATFALGPFYARTTTMVGAGTAIDVGLLLKLPLVRFAWSR